LKKYVKSKKKFTIDFVANNDLLFETTSVFLILSQFQKLKINADLLNKLFSDFGITKNSTIDEVIGLHHQRILNL
jgi:hypothetical protein